MEDYIKRSDAIKAAERTWNEWDLASVAINGGKAITFEYSTPGFMDEVINSLKSGEAVKVVRMIVRYNEGEKMFDIEVEE